MFIYICFIYNLVVTFFFKDYIKESLRSSLYFSSYMCSLCVGNSIAWVLEMQ